MWRARCTYFSRKTSCTGPERGAGRALGLVDGVLELLDSSIATRMPRPPPPIGALHDDGVSEFAGELLRIGAVGDGIAAAGQDRHLGEIGDLAGRDLVAEVLEHADVRADENDAGIEARLREVRILREEAVAGMDRVDLVLLGDSDDARDVEVRLERLADVADAIGLIRLEAVQGEAILLRVDGDRADAELVGGAEDTDRDLAAIGDEQLLDGPGNRHRCSRKVEGEWTGISYGGGAGGSQRCGP